MKETAITATPEITQWLLGTDSDLRVISERDRRGMPLRTVLDLKTGLIRNDPVPSTGELDAFYAEKYRLIYKGNARPRKRQALRNFKGAANYICQNYDIISRCRRTLDIGSGSGEFLFLLRALGGDGIGIEPSQSYSEFCRDEYGLSVATASLQESLFEEASFDFIRMSHVLEHLNDPIRYIRMVSRWLQPNGVLYIEVPNIERYCAAKSSGGLFHFAHIYNFNPWTLRAVSHLAGMKELETTKARYADETSIFLTKGDEQITSMETINPSNGERLLALISEHQRHGPRLSPTKKMIRKLKKRISETIQGARSATLLDLAKAQAAQLQKKIGLTNRDAA